MPESRYEKIYAVVRRIPRGRVATYGQVADVAGLPGQARQVGYAMAALGGDTRVPWQRVINARGEVSERRNPDGAIVQRLLLEEEGVDFDHAGRVALSDHRWRPRQSKRNKGP